MIALVVELAAVGIGAAWRGHPIAATLGTTIGLTAAVSADWSSHDDSGLWVVGVVMVFIGTLVVGGLVTSVTAVISGARTAAGLDQGT